MMMTAHTNTLNDKHVQQAALITLRFCLEQQISPDASSSLSYAVMSA